ncbi:MAG: serine/threonine protein kinase [Planctomycetes bacterium]|nr:serine/threonine protein kinase [Planctomycetota bacterium]
MDPRPPETLGRYRLLSEAPVPGSSKTYRAEDPFLGREVLLKALEAGSAPAERAARFRQEMRLAARLSHPGLFRVLDAGEDGDWLWFAMERLEGRTLRAEMDERKRLPLARALGVLVGILLPLDYLHASQVVHRDVKPENVLLVPCRLEPEGRPVLLDLGIAKDRSDAGRTITRHGERALGSEYYAAPEALADAARATFASDVYSTGVLLYEMLAGRLPVGSNFPALDDCVPDAPCWIQMLFETMHASDERARFAKAGDVLAALREQVSPEAWHATARSGSSPHDPPRSAREWEAARAPGSGRGKTPFWLAWLPGRGRAP